jgi:hypothetical protein
MGVGGGADIPAICISKEQSTRLVALWRARRWPSQVLLPPYRNNCDQGSTIVTGKRHDNLLATTSCSSGALLKIFNDGTLGIWFSFIG